MVKLSIVVPCFNEQDALPIFYNEIIKVADSLKELEFEFLFVNEESKDNTFDILNHLLQIDARFHYISLQEILEKKPLFMQDLKNQMVIM